jgi:hypothetical protein
MATVFGADSSVFAMFEFLRLPLSLHLTFIPAGSPPLQWLLKKLLPLLLYSITELSPGDNLAWKGASQQVKSVYVTESI